MRITVADQQLNVIEDITAMVTEAEMLQQDLADLADRFVIRHGYSLDGCEATVLREVITGKADYQTAIDRVMESISNRAQRQ